MAGGLRRHRAAGLEISSATLFAIALAIALFVTSDALFPLLVSGGIESSIDSSATSRMRLLERIAAYAVFGLCFVVSWRSAIAAVRENLLLCLMIALAGISPLWSDDPWKSAYSAAQLAIGGLFALMVAQRLQLRVALLVAFATYAAIIAISLAVIVVRPDLGTSSSEMYHGAWRGAFIHKNHFGTQLSIAFATFVAAGIYWRGWSRWVALTLLPVTLGLAVLSRSSTAVFTCAGVAGIFFLILLMSRSRSAFYAVLGAVVAFGSTGAVILAGGWETIMEMIGKDPDISGRGELWSMIFNSIQHRPFLGFGYQSFWTSTAADGGEAITRNVAWRPGGAHNAYIEIAAELGLVGLGLWLVVYLRTSVAALSLAFQRLRLPGVPVIWPALVLFALTCWSMVETNLMLYANSVQFVFVLMTGYVLHFDHRKTAGRG
jgi:O-antigen ligase